MTLTVGHRNGNADIRERLKDLRAQRNRAEQHKEMCRQAAANYAGADVHRSDELKRLEAAHADLEQIKGEITLLEAEEQHGLHQLTPQEGARHNESFMNDPQLVSELQHLAFSEARFGTRDLGFALSRDEYIASIQRTSVYERPGVYGAAGDVTVPAGARASYYGLQPQMVRPLRLLDLLPVAPMDVGQFDYTPISGNLDTAAEVSDAAVKATADIVLGSATAKAQTVAHFHKIPKPQLADVPGLQTAIESRLVYGVNRRIEQAAINGSGVDPALLGILNVSGIGAPASVAGDAVNADLALNGKTAVAKSGGVANGIVMHPDDVAKALKKTATGSGVRLDSDGAFGAVPTSMWGLPLVEIAVPALSGKAIVADWSIAGTVFVREGVHVLVSDSDADDFTRNRLALLGEARVAFAWWQPSAVAVVALGFAA